MTKRYALFTILALGACAPTPKPVAAGAAAGEGAAPAAVRRMPGQWQVTSMMTRYEVPSAPADVIATMTGRLNVPDVGEVCVTAEDAARDTLRTRLSEALVLDAACKLTDKSSGGTIDVVAICTNQPPAVVTLRYSGTLSPTQGEIRVESDGIDKKSGATSKFAIALKTRRMGPCTE
jgi:Protein of unknown function (DUF3617)